MNAKRLVFSLVLFVVAACGIMLAQPALAEEPQPVSPLVASGDVIANGEKAWDGFALGVVTSNGTLTQTAVVKGGVYTATVMVGETVTVYHEHKCENLSTPLSYTATVGADLRLPHIVVECRTSKIASGDVIANGEKAWDGFALGVVTSNGTLTQTAVVKGGVYTATVMVGETVTVYHEHKCENLSTPLSYTATVGADLRLPNIKIECRYFVNLPIVARGKTLVTVQVNINGSQVPFSFGIEFWKGDKSTGALTANGLAIVEFPEYGVWEVKHDHPCPYEPRQVEITASTSVLTINLTCK